MLTRAQPILPLLLLSVGSGALANDTDIPTCETNTGVAGTVFQEQFGTIRAPELCPSHLTARQDAAS